MLQDLLLEKLMGSFHMFLLSNFFDFLGNLINSKSYKEFELSLIEGFVGSFLFFLILILIFGIIGVLLKNKIQIKEIGKWKYVFVYIFPWFFGGIIWSPIIFGLLHKKLDKNFFIHSAVSVFLYLISLGIIFIVLEF